MNVWERELDAWFLLLQYDAKVFVSRIKDNNCLLSTAQQVAESINANDKKAVYRHLVKSDVNVNAIRGEAGISSYLHNTKKNVPNEKAERPIRIIIHCCPGFSSNIPSSTNDSNTSCENTIQPVEDIQDSSTVLHLACRRCDVGMVELLLQYGADVNAIDSKGKTPLHYCTMMGKHATAKVLITR